MPWRRTGLRGGSPPAEGWHDEASLSLARCTGSGCRGQVPTAGCRRIRRGLLVPRDTVRSSERQASSRASPIANSWRESWESSKLECDEAAEQGVEVPTRTIQRALFGKDGGTTGVDDDFAARGFENVGAWILGRNMFGPLRGSWPDMDWKGWWGENPPYHVPVFIMTHHARPPIEMEGDTTFHFVTGGIRDALERAREAAGGMDVRVGGGPNTIQQYLRESLIEELHIAIAPVLLGGGERLFEGVDLRALGYECVEFVASEKATHVVLRHQGARGRLATVFSGGGHGCATPRRA